MAPKRKAKADNADGAAPAPKMSAYQAYVKSELARVKELNPSLDHGAAFAMVAAGWKQHPTNPKRAPTDWKTPLFYWRGAIDGDTWSGTWVASADGLPSDADFAASENTFTLKCSVATLPKADRDGGSFTGSYKLDQGDGLEDFSDLSHDIFAISGPGGHHPLGECNKDWAVVGATGNTEFGRFVSLGRLDGPPLATDSSVSIDRTYTRLTLARRYVDDDDPRLRLSAEQLADRVVWGADEWAISAPWIALPWKISAVPEAFGHVFQRGKLYESAGKAFGPLISANAEEEDTACWVGVGPLLYGPLLD